MSVQLSGPDFGHAQRFSDTLADDIQRFAETSPESRLIEYPVDGACEEFRAGLLLKQAFNLCGELQSIDEQAVLILCFERVSEFIAAAWACTFLGRWYLPWMLSPAGLAASSARARAQALQQCFPNAQLVFSQDNRALSLQLAQPEHRWQTHAVAFQTEAARPGPAQPRLGAGCYLPTSGSSGGAKFARLPNAVLCARLEASKAVPGASTTLSCLPFDGVTGHAMMMPWSGTRLYFPAARIISRAEELPALIEGHRINSLPLTTSLQSKLVDALEVREQAADLSSLERVSVGAEPISAQIAGRFVEQCQRHGAQEFDIGLAYGMTETGTLARIGLPDLASASQHLGDGSHPISMGPATRFTGIRITDAFDRVIEEGLPGLIQIKAPQRMFDGYQTSAGLDRSCFTADGWFRTGDRGLIENGQLAVLGRESGSMRLAGRTVSLEHIESALSKSHERLTELIVAAPFQDSGSASAELALFYVARPGQDSRDIARSLKKAATELIGASPRHLIPLLSDQVPRTASAKIVRPDLIEAFASGQLQALSLDPLTLETPSSDLEALKQIWARQLGIDADFDLNATFFDLGADSIAAAEMIETVERRFACRIPLDQFFRNATVPSLLALIKSGDQSTLAISPAPAAKIIRKLETALSTWEGPRPGGGIIPCYHAEGRQVPLFWVFQEQQELKRLAAALGDSHPLHGLRSLVGIVPIRAHDATVLNAVCDRYQAELLERIAGRAYVLGGNCQGGIHALALARRLRQQGQPPSSLVLMEWSYSYGPYPGPVHLLYGSDSYTARYYTTQCTEGPPWRQEFQQRSVQSIRGRHGRFFNKHNIDSLAGQLRRICVAANTGVDAQAKC